MKKYDYLFDGKETITVKGKGLKEAVRDYKQQFPKQLRAEVEWMAKSGNIQKKIVKQNMKIMKHFFQKLKSFRKKVFSKKIVNFTVYQQSVAAF